MNEEVWEKVKSDPTIPVKLVSDCSEYNKRGSELSPDCCPHSCDIYEGFGELKSFIVYKYPDEDVCTCGKCNDWGFYN